MIEQYQVILHSQMGPRAGELTLRYEGTLVQGSLKLVGHLNPVQGVRAGDGTLHLFHPIQTAVSTFPCETVLELKGSHLDGVTTAEFCQMRWEGTRMPPES